MAFFPGWKDTLLAAALGAATIEGLVIDNFAGGGGASTGIEAAIGRPIDVAINHDDKALAMHRANHPSTLHISNNIKRVDPVATAAGRRIGLAWFSPDCKHHSKAKGGKPRDKDIRDLAWVVVRWAFAVQPDCIIVENVEEFEDWGPLRKGRPIKARKGETFRFWIAKLRQAGYEVEWRQLRACDYGAPTIRKRIFIIARRDGRPIVWPQPTHGAPGSLDVAAGILQPYRTAAECIDWSITCPSIFERRKPLAEATLRRIAHGVMRFVVNNPRPFIVPITHSGPPRGHGIDDQVRTITTANRGEQALVAPHITKFRTGSIGHDAGEPLEQPYFTATAKGSQGAAVSAFLTHFYGSDKRAAAGDPREPSRAVTAGGQHHGVVCAHIEQANTGMVGHRPQKPLSTIVGKGCTQRVIQTTMVVADSLPPELMQKAVRTAAFLVKYYGSADDGQTVADPLHSTTAKARFAVVTVTIDAETYVLVDIGMRMLGPHELFNAQGFPPDYDIEAANDNGGKPLTKTQQIEKCGNSVCPPVAEALVRANFSAPAEERIAA
ncbi:MAG TPA: DNA cytosine methyltransferase [Allosphingosinicella sp.]|nr:DNA cytosine methyltransferase [Allosphingosinicella sp.]